ncbi:MAG: MATE family efflux transporter [Spirochaetaceae bacterium]|nr:MATE family efflux transporter [Spirochaetaceae bacterium]
MKTNESSIQKELLRREFILSAEPYRVIFSIALPLVFYSSMSQIFQFVDTLIAANMSANVISTVSFISQIHSMLTAIASGLAVGGGIIISRSFGAGDMQAVRERISTLFFLVLAIGGGILALVIPLAYPFLRLMRMPEDLLKDGVPYFILEMIGLISLFINTMYLAIEKSRGNTKKIMAYNMGVLFIKTAMNIVLVYGVKGNMFVLPIATIAAQGFLTAIAMINLLSKKNPFQVSLKSCRFRRDFLAPLSSLSVPVFLEKFVFSFGKVLVNSMCAHYGSTVVGALGVSNRLGGLSTNPPSGFEEAESSIISQNVGAQNVKRALGVFYRTFAINLVLSFIIFVLTGIFKDTIITLFAKGDHVFADEVSKIYGYERLDAILVSMNTSVMGLLYGFGKTRISMVLNMVRLFVFRIPSLFIMMHLNIGIEAVGIAMLISNSLTGITSALVAVFFVRKLLKTSAVSPAVSIARLA